MRMRAVCVASACGLGALSASAQVVNGGFEQPGQGFHSVGAGQTYGGWTNAGPHDIEFVHATPNASLPGLEFSAYEGSYWIDLVGVGAPSAIFQDLTTTPGAMYEVSFALAGNVWQGAQTMNLNVLWNGAVQGAFSHSTAGHTGANMGWTVYSVQVTATGLDRLTFRAMSGGNAAGPAIDDVRIQLIPAPGAAGLLLMAGGMAARRRR